MPGRIGLVRPIGAHALFVSFQDMPDIDAASRATKVAKWRERRIKEGQRQEWSAGSSPEGQDVNF